MYQGILLFDKRDKLGIDMRTKIEVNMIIIIVNRFARFIAITDTFITN